MNFPRPRLSARFRVWIPVGRSRSFVKAKRQQRFGGGPSALYNRRFRILTLRSDYFYYCGYIPGRSPGTLRPAHADASPALSSGAARFPVFLTGRLGPAGPHPRSPSTRQPPYSRGNHQGPDVHQPGRGLRPGGDRAQLQLLVEHRLFRRHPLRARADTPRLDHPRLHQGKADHPRDQVPRPELGFAVRRAGPIQGTQGLAYPGKPVRSNPRQARRGCDQGPAGRARPPVRHYPHRDSADSAGCRFRHLRGQGRPQGEGGPHQVREQQEREVAHAALRHAPLAAHRHPPLHLPGKPFLAHLRRHQAQRRHGNGPRRLPAARLLQGYR